MQVNVLKAIAIITTNFDFFSAPLLDQPAFKRWVTHSRQEENIRMLTDTLYIPLTNPTSYISEYIDALIGKPLENNDYACLRFGCNKRLAKLLHQNNHLRQAILSLHNNKVIQQWNKDHQQRVQKTKNIQQLFNHLEFLNLKANELIIKEVVDDAKILNQLITQINTLLIQFINGEANKSIKELNDDCLQIIAESKQKLYSHWDIQQQFNHLLFFLKETLPNIFPNSFFNERSELSKNLIAMENVIDQLNQIG